MRIAPWIALALGWILILKGYALPGVCAVASFAVVRMVQYRQRQSMAAQAQPVGADIRANDTAPLPPRDPAPSAARITTGQREARWRRMVLASYGNAYLHGNIVLEDWFRHRALWDAAFAFRDSVDGRLLATNSLAWLQWIKRRGATRISLCMTDKLPAIARVGEWDPQVIVVAFPGSHEIWMAGKEIADSKASACPNTDHLACEPEIDAYWRIETGTGASLPAPVDWQQMRTHIQEALRMCPVPEIDADLSENGFAPLKACFAHCPDWADLPLLPADETLAIPHALLRDLSRIRSSLESFCHPKNDASPYQSYSAEDHQRLDAFRATLERLIEEVQCAAGSESRWNFAGFAPFPGARE